MYVNKKGTKYWKYADYRISVMRCFFGSILRNGQEAPLTGKVTSLQVIPILNQALSLLASSSASSTYVQYASSPPPSRRDIIIDLEME